MKEIVLKWFPWMLVCTLLVLGYIFGVIKQNQIDSIIEASREAVVAFAKECN